MNVYGLLNCFRQDAHLDFQRAILPVKVRRGSSEELLYHSPGLSITLPHWLVKCLLKTEANSTARTCDPLSNS